MTVSPYDNLPVKGREPEPLKYIEVPIEDLVDQEEDMKDASNAAEVTNNVDAADIATTDPLGNATVEAADATDAADNRNNATDIATADPVSDTPSTPTAAESSALRDSPMDNSTASSPILEDAPRPICATPLDKPPQYSQLSIRNPRPGKEFLLPVEETLLVPDTMEDISRILFAEGKVTLSPSCKLTYARGDILSGELTVFTVYKPDKRTGIDVVKSTVPFKTDKCFSNTSENSFTINISIKTIGCQLINERKFALKAQLSINVTEIYNGELKIYQGTEDRDMIPRQQQLSLTNLDFEGEESTTISQDISIKEGNPLPRKILKTNISVVENHKQITSGKLVVNGTIHSAILYEGEDEGEAKLCSISNKTDFTQFIPIRENINIDLIRLCFCCQELNITISDSNNFLIEGHVRTLIYGYMSKEVKMVSDMYHKTCDLSFAIEKQPLSMVQGTLYGEVSAREALSLESFGSGSVTLLCGSCNIMNLTGKPERGRITIDGLLQARVLAKNEDEEPFLIDCKLPLRGSLETQGQGGYSDDTVCDIWGAVKDFWFDEINGHQIEFNAAVSINIWMIKNVSFTTPVNLCCVQSSEPRERIPMALYVVGRGDSLWDIAKKYKSDSSTIAAANNIDENSPLLEGMKLLVTK